MTRRFITTILAIILVSLPAVGIGAANRPGPYVTGFLGVSVISDSNVTSNDFVTNRSFSDRVEFDPGVNVGGTGGYDFGFFRVEGELSYKSADIKTITDRADGYRFRSVDGSLGAFAMLGNVFLDIHNDSRVTPYLGGGIGFAALHISDTTGIDTRGATTTRTLLYGSGDDTVFAGQVGAGVDIAFTNRYSLDVGYRYFITDTANFDSDLATASSMRFESHNVSVGFKFKF